MCNMPKNNAFAVCNIIWLILIVASASIGIVSTAVYLLAVQDVQILSWSIGYILTSGTNSNVLMPSLLISLVSWCVFALCIIRGVMMDRAKNNNRAV